MNILATKPREISQKTESLRKEGIIPAVMYGPKEDSVSISVSRKEFENILKEAGKSTVITLETVKGKKNALIHEVQFDPVKGNPIHADFYIVEKGKEVEVQVPLEFVGVSPAVKELGGTLVKVLHELSVKGAPAKLPHSIEVDISILKTFDDSISAKDIILPEGVSLVEKPDEIIALASEVKEEEEVTLEKEDISEIEVEKKGKKPSAEGDAVKEEEKSEKK
jgi:large subunit ribosomal protein L25